ncbi:hypothetical protein ES703_117876 [subsurface metagenome]
MKNSFLALYAILSAIVPTHFRPGAIFVPILGSLRGSVGNNTWSHNRGGDYIRRRVAPTNPNSNRQQTMRALLSTYASAWSLGLLPAQREAWNTWAGQQAKEGPLGNSINLTGINGFIWCNTHILDAGDARTDDPPAQIAPDALLTFAVDVSALNTADVTFTTTPLGGTIRIVLFMSLPQSGEAEPNFKQCRIVGYSDLGQASPWAATMPFPVLPDQKVIFFAARYQSISGLFSGFLRAVDTADY